MFAGRVVSASNLIMSAQPSARLLTGTKTHLYLVDMHIQIQLESDLRSFMSTNLHLIHSALPSPLVCRQKTLSK